MVRYLMFFQNLWSRRGRSHFWFWVLSKEHSTTKKWYIC